MTVQKNFATLWNAMAGFAAERNTDADKTIEGGEAEFKRVFVSELMADRIAEAMHGFIQASGRSIGTSMTRFEDRYAKDPEMIERDTMIAALEVETWDTLVREAKTILEAAEKVYEDACQQPWVPFKDRLHQRQQKAEQTAEIARAKLAEIRAAQKKSA